MVMLPTLHETELLMFLSICIMDYIIKGNRVACFDFPFGSVAK